MKLSSITVRSSDILHMRPAADLINFACLFNECKISIFKKNLCFEPKSLMATISSQLQNNDKVSVDVVGKDEEIVLAFMKVFLENLFLTDSVYKEGINDGLKGERKRRLEEAKLIKGRRELYSRLEDAVSRYPLEATKEYLESIQGLFGLLPQQQVCQLDAILKSEHGMHLLACGLLAQYARKFKSRIELLYTSTDGKPGSCDVINIAALVGTALTDRAPIVVRAVGSDCEVAAKSIKIIVEHIDELRQALRDRPDNTNEGEIVWRIIENFT